VSPPDQKILQVFLCHASEDKPTVRQLYERLTGLSWVKPWLDEEDLIPGQNWQKEIPKAVCASHVVLVCLSQNSITKEGFIQKEIKDALDVADEKPEDTIYLIPLRLEECKVPERVKAWHWVDYFKEKGFAQLLRALRFRAIGLGITIDNIVPAVASVAPTSSPVVTPFSERNPTPFSQWQPRWPDPMPIPLIEPQSVETEQNQLLQELKTLITTHERRLAIGKRLDEIGDTRPGVGIGADGIPDILWLPVVPGGKLKLENNETHEVQPFFIASYPVTYTQYEAFVSASDGYNNSKWWQGMPQAEQKGKLDKQNNKGSNNPRENVSWYQSVAFGRWLNQRLQGLELNWLNNSGNGKLFIIGRNAEVRLPLEWEWQWAAQGGQAQQTHPWGNKWQEGYANRYEAGLEQTTAVGMYPQGRAACGAYDMSGNVWEWCANKYSNDQGWKVVRGGSFHYIQRFAACDYRDYYRPFYRDFNIGFRLVVASL
jgi:hypothetical protein